MPLARRCAAELIGTFILLACGCGAVIVDNDTKALTLSGVAVVWGLVVLALVYALGDLSGCHINPAVTVGFAAAGRFPWQEVPLYLAAQVAGAFAAAGVLTLLFPENDKPFTTLPRGAWGQSFALEVFLTWFLMLAVLGVSTGAKEKGITAGIAVGGVIALEVLVGGPISGASMNPARSLAPAVVTGHVGSLWIYLLAPTLGAVLAVPTYYFLRPERNK